MILYVPTQMKGINAMKTTELFQNKSVLSFEVFPPKRTNPVDTIYKTIDSLKDLDPDFISVTYGAGGSENCKATLKIASRIKNEYGIESVAHLLHQPDKIRCTPPAVRFQGGRHREHPGSSRRRASRRLCARRLPPCQRSDRLYQRTWRLQMSWLPAIPKATWNPRISLMISGT